MSADPGVDWVPVAGLLEAASSQLEVGQLLHTSVFSLFEAMSAVEIGNPKMDAGKLMHTRLSLGPLAAAEIAGQQWQQQYRYQQQQQH